MVYRAGKVIAFLCLLIANLFWVSVSAAQDVSYTLNPGDRLLVSVWNEENLTRELVVLPDGTIGFPLVGSVKVAGLTPTQAETTLETELIKSIKSPRATVVVTAVDGNRAYIIGKVRSPGAYIIQARMSAAQLIALAGGFAEFAKENKVAILRQLDDGTFSRIRINLTKLLDGDADEMSQEQILKAGDLVIVP